MSDSEETNELKSYRMKFLPVFVFMLACLLIWGAIFYILGFIKQNAIAIAIFASCLASIPVVWLIIFMFPTRAGSKGIRSYTSYGLFRMIEWQDIVSVKQTDIPGLKAMQVISQTGQAIWIPLFLSHSEEFRKTVIESAQDPDNPLVRHLLNKQEDTPEESGEGEES
jgi:hypothetical protein